MTADEYAEIVQSLVLRAGLAEPRPGTALAEVGLFPLASGAAAAVRGKGRAFEITDTQQSFEGPDARAVDWLVEAADEITDCAAWITGASEIGAYNDLEPHRDAALWHLGAALHALYGWLHHEFASEAAEQERAAVHEASRPDGSPAA